MVVLESVDHGLNLRSHGWISSVDHFSGSKHRCHLFWGMVHSVSVLSFIREAHHQVHGSLLLNCMVAEVAQGFGPIALASLIPMQSV